MRNWGKVSKARGVVFGGVSPRLSELLSPLFAINDIFGLGVSSQPILNYYSEIFGGQQTNDLMDLIIRSFISLINDGIVVPGSDGFFISDIRSRADMIQCEDDGVVYKDGERNNRWITGRAVGNMLNLMGMRGRSSHRANKRKVVVEYDRIIDVIERYGYTIEQKEEGGQRKLKVTKS